MEGVANCRILILEHPFLESGQTSHQVVRFWQLQRTAFFPCLGCALSNHGSNLLSTLCLNMSIHTIVNILLRHKYMEHLKVGLATNWFEARCIFLWCPKLLILVSIDILDRISTSS